jgi:flagellar motor switch/type III secretory pathway protein FliN
MQASAVPSPSTPSTDPDLAPLAAAAVARVEASPPAAPVSLVVEDRTLGTGELVMVEGELGVRVLSLG